MMLIVGVRMSFRMEQSGIPTGHYSEKSSNSLAAPRSGRSEPSELPVFLLATSSTGMIEDFYPKGTIVAALLMNKL
jgi:hypothetical protein